MAQTTTHIQPTAVSSRDGAAVHMGDWVHYSGSIWQLLGQIMQIQSISSDGRLVLETATGGRVKRVRGQSVRPCDKDCRHGGEG